MTDRPGLEPHGAGTRSGPSSRAPAAAPPAPHPLSPRALLLVTLPGLLFLAVWISFLRVKGPYWLGSNLDPEYPYLLNGLNLATGQAPGHVDHPGTPVQLLMAGVVGAGHLLGGQGGLVDDVLGRPEHFLLLGNAVLMVLAWLALAWAGAATWRATGSTAAALLVQAVPALSSRTLAQIACVRPEPLLLALVAALVALSMGALERAGEPGARRAVVLGVVVGVAACTKITAAPLVLLPLLLLRRPAARLALVGATLLAFALSLAPALPHLDVFGAFLLRIATHSGQYGAGAPSLFDPVAYARGLGQVLARSPELLATLAAGAAVWWAGRRREALRKDLRVRALGGALAAQAATVLLVARHPAPHYLLPAIGLSGLTLALSAVLGPAAFERRRLALALAVPLAAFLAVREGAMGLARFRRLERDRTEHLAAAEAAKGLPGATVVYYYRASAPAFALRFGDELSAGRWTAWLDAHHAGTVFYNPFTRAFGGYGPGAFPPPPGRPLLFQGSTLGTEPFTEALAGHGLTPLFAGRDESVYRAPGLW